MKKFYSIIASALIGSAMVASAAVALPYHSNELSNAPLRNISELRLPQMKLNTPSAIQKSVAGPVSREEYEVDPCVFTQCMYIDYFYNWYDDGVELSEFRNLQTSNEVEIIDNGDDTMTIKYFFDVSVFSPTLYLEDGQLVFHLGEELFRDDSGQRYVLASANLDSDQPLVTGSLPLAIYTNGMVIEDFLGVYVVGPQGGWYSLSLYTAFLQPNSTLKYSYQRLDAEGYPLFDEDGNPDIVEVNNKVYTEYRKAEDSGEPYDAICISNIMPWNSGISVAFSFYDTDEMSILVAFDQIIAPSKWNGEYYTGDFYLCGAYTDTNQYDTNVLADITEDGLTWPGVDEELGMTPDMWMAMSLVSGDFYPPFEPATLTFNIEEGEDGIIDIVDDTTTGAPVYYNIQGVRINHPEAGQICIVKDGNKVSKTIIR